MRNRRFIAHIFGTVSAIGLVSSQAFAGLCYSGISISSSGVVTNTKAFPASGSSGLSLNCGTGVGVITITATGVGITNAAGGKSIQVNKTSGNGLTTVEGLNSSGAVVCSVVDSSANGIASTILSCPATAVRWRLSASYVD
jgi:hypothetical protein